MKVLHIWNTAGVASLMSKHLRKRGVSSDVLMRKGYDPFNMSEYYGNTNLNMGGAEFIKHSIEQSEKYDIIHIHGIWRIAETIKKKYPHKKIILQHHGTELTKCLSDHERIDSYKYCDDIICSTMDLSKQLDYERVKHTLVENSVDTDLFKPNEATNKCEPALIFNIRYIELELTKEFVRSNSKWDLDIIDREISYINYTQMPTLLNKYDKYVDVKIYKWLSGKPGMAYSKTGREALACGLSVLNYEGKIVKGLPDEYTPEYMIETLTSIYNR